MKKPTKHNSESNENLIQDEINVDLSRASRISKKRVVHARNNNYFSPQGHIDQVEKTTKKTANNYLNTYSDEDEEFIVGKVDDVEVFKLGKIN